MTSCCAMMTKRNDAGDYLYLSSDSGFIRDVYFENDVRSGIRKVTKSSETRIQIGDVSVSI